VNEILSFYKLKRLTISGSGTRRQIDLYSTIS
jgi:hypothetical protein